MRVGLALLSVLTRNLVFIHVTFLKTIDLTHMYFKIAEASVACVSVCVPDARLSLSVTKIRFPSSNMLMLDIKELFFVFLSVVCHLHKASTQI